MPALEPYLIEPILWQQFLALLMPERRTDHPLGCHRSRIPERVVFEKLVQVLVFGCASNVGVGAGRGIGSFRLSGQGCVGASLGPEGPYITLSDPKFMGGT